MHIAAPHLLTAELRRSACSCRCTGARPGTLHAAVLRRCLAAPAPRPAPAAGPAPALAAGGGAGCCAACNRAGSAHRALAARPATAARAGSDTGESRQAGYEWARSWEAGGDTAAAVPAAACMFPAMLPSAAAAEGPRSVLHAALSNNEPPPVPPAAASGCPARDAQPALERHSPIPPGQSSPQQQQSATDAPPPPSNATARRGRPALHQHTKEGCVRRTPSLAQHQPNASSSKASAPKPCSQRASTIIY